MSYIVEIKSSADIARILVLLDNGYTLESMVANKTPELEIGSVVDVMVGAKYVFVGIPRSVINFHTDEELTTSQLLTTLGLDKE